MTTSHRAGLGSLRPKAAVLLAGACVVVFAATASAQVRVTALSAAVSSSATLQVSAGVVQCRRDTVSGPPEWSDSERCTETIGECGPTTGSGRVATTPDPLNRPLVVFEIRGPAAGSTSGGSECTFLSAAAGGAASFSVTFVLDRPTFVRVKAQAFLASFASDLLEIVPVFDDLGQGETRVLVQPGTFTIYASLDAAASGSRASDSSDLNLRFEFEPLRPVFVIPGIGATYASTPALDALWLMIRGVPPALLQIDPLLRGYHDLIKTFENLGYVRGRDLFIVNYDWRLLPGPLDGALDGQIAGLTAANISAGTYRYAVDYFGELLKSAAEQWRVDHPDLPPLETVDVVTHSTGGLVARTYIQSAAYGGDYEADRQLPRIENLIMIGVPNRGASKAWNPLQDNWTVETAFQIVLSKIIDRAYQKVVAGGIVPGPDHLITASSLQGANCPSGDPHVCFINLYVPTVRALLATYDFYDDGDGILRSINADPTVRNSLLLDLNAGLDGPTPAGDPNAFADEAKVTLIYGTNGEDTPTHVVRRTGPTLVPAPFRPIARFDDVLARNAGIGEEYFEDVKEEDAGDGTVPLLSSIGQFVGDARIAFRPFTHGVNTQESVGHTDLTFNFDVQTTILEILEQVFDPAQISTSEHGESLAIACAITGCLNFVLDPVDGVVVDAQGRRLGYTAATGPLNEIPGSIWFGTNDGMGWILGPVEQPLTLQLTGLGEPYYVEVTSVGSDAPSGVVESGFLAAGETKVLPIGAAAPNLAPTANAGSDRVVRQGSRVLLSGSGSDTDNGPGPLQFAWTQSAGPAVSLTGITTSTPSFTPTLAATYTLTLVVNDGAIDSEADAALVVVPRLGDIDQDGDVDQHDLNLLLARRNTAADGPNDLRDLDGNAVIDAVDSRRLTTLCTRARCAVR